MTVEDVIELVKKRQKQYLHAPVGTMRVIRCVGAMAVFTVQWLRNTTFSLMKYNG